jgi:hypothetical protein
MLSWTWHVLTLNEMEMPCISTFHGVSIYMYYRDHAPPHFHALSGDDEVLIQFNPPSVYRGSLPAKTLKKVLRWASLHQDELDDNWQRATNGQPLLPIPPLP